MEMRRRELDGEVEGPSSSLPLVSEEGLGGMGRKELDGRLKGYTSRRHNRWGGEGLTATRLLARMSSLQK